jgi:diguanylate cyclase (GGDEF)-like protein
MNNRSESLGAAVRVAVAAASALLLSAAFTAGASAQALPGIGALPNGGADVEVGPDGAKVEVDAGDSGGVTVEAGPGGVGVGLRTTPKATTPPPAAGDGGAPVSVPGGPTEDPRSGTSPGRAPADGAPRRSITVSPGDPGSAGGRAGGGAPAATGRDGEQGRVDGARAAERANRTDEGGVAPVFDLVERIPAAVRAGLVALALIALALWALWVRARSRLAHNAYVDPDTGVGNMAAFEQVLEREWQRAARYRRPLGLVLLDLEQEDSGMRLLGEREARWAVEGIDEEVREADTVARLAPGRFAVVCPEAPAGSVETLAHALELRMEARRLRCRTGFAERRPEDASPADLVTHAAAVLSEVGSRTRTGQEARVPLADVSPLAPGRAAA